MEAVSDETFDAMAERLFGDDGNAFVGEMQEIASALNEVLRPTFQGLARRSERKLARAVIRGMLSDIEATLWEGMRPSIEINNGE